MVTNILVLLVCPFSEGPRAVTVNLYSVAGVSCVRVREVEVVLRVKLGPELDTSQYERKYVHELKAVEPREVRMMMTQKHTMITQIYHNTVEPFLEDISIMDIDLLIPKHNV